MNSTTQGGFCPVADEVYRHFWILMVHCAVIVFNTTGSATTFWVSLVFIRYRVFHINLRFLFSNLTIQLAVRAICTIVRSGTYVVHYSTFTDACELRETESGCARKAALFASFQDTLIFSFVALGVERAWATFKYDIYERQRGCLFRTVLLVISWTRVIYVVIQIAVGGFPDSDHLIEYCTSISLKNFDGPFLYFIHLPIAIFCGLLFAYVYIRSAKKNRELLNEQFTLSSRFQLMENIQTYRIVTPCGILYVVIVLINVGFFLFLDQTRHHFSDVNLVFWKEIASLAAFPLFINIYPLLFFLLSPSIRRQFKACQVGSQTHVFVVDRHENASEHMHHLEQFWAASRTRH